MSRCGFVSVIGRTNAGKSSMINALLGQKLNFVSHKQNATRRKLNSIVMSGDDQIIFMDTPGLHKSTKNFNQHLLNTAFKAIDDCDLVVFVVSVLDSVEVYEEFLQKYPDKKHILILNKVDLVTNEQLLNIMSNYVKYSDKFISLLPFSSKQKSYVNVTLKEIAKYLPEHEYFYDPSDISDSNVRDIVADLILESIFDNVSDEVPYCCDVRVEKFLHIKEKINIFACIITDNDSHKAILIGKEGQCIKRIGINARKKISDFLESKINLKLIVDVKKNWYNDDNILRKLKIYCD